MLWVVFLVDAALGLRLGRFGLRPGSVSGLVGILAAPLLHANAQHLLSNTVPLLVSLTATLYLYPASSLRVIPLIWLGSGAIAWFIGRPSLHFGVSGLIYGLLAYVFVSGILRRDMRSVSVSLLVGFLYGSMVWGVLPIQPHMSWEMHLGGVVIGGSCWPSGTASGTGFRWCATTGKTMKRCRNGILKAPDKDFDPPKPR